MECEGVLLPDRGSMVEVEREVILDPDDLGRPTLATSDHAGQLDFGAGIVVLGLHRPAVGVDDFYHRVWNV